MSGMVDNTNLSKNLLCETVDKYEFKEKYEEIDDNTCEICYSNHKNDIICCKTCNQKICFECFNKNPVKNVGADILPDEEFENGKSHIYLTMNCFFCREENNYNIGDFSKEHNNILTNNCIKELGSFIKDLRKSSQYDTAVIEKIQDVKTIFEVAEENNMLKGKLKYYENTQENFIEMKMKFDNLMTSYNKNIQDYNNLVNEANILKNAYKDIGIVNNYICNQRDIYKNAYVNGINEIKSKNKNKNLDKFIDNKLKELDKKTTEIEVKIDINFNELDKK